MFRVFQRSHGRRILGHWEGDEVRDKDDRRRVQPKMYQVSRAIYRELAGDIATGRDGHAAVLRACEGAIERLATDRHYIAQPARTLFRDIRVHFPLQSQARVWVVVRDYVDAAEQLLAALSTRGRDAFGNRLQCRATTRRGTACQRVPVHENGYCPSHQHLVETEELELAAILAAEASQHALAA